MAEIYRRRNKRTEAIQELLAALEQRDYELAVRVALGIAGEATQGKTLRGIVDHGIARGMPLQVIDVPAEIAAARERALTFLDLGKDLASRGYRLMAEQEFAAAAKAAKARRKEAVHG
jgi:hypothetical protein